MRRSGGVEAEGGFWAAGDHVTQKQAAATARRVERNAGEERPRDTGLKKLPADRVTSFVVVRRKLNAIVWKPRAANPIVEKPVHGAAVFPVHGRCHDRFHFVLKVTRG